MKEHENKIDSTEIVDYVACQIKNEPIPSLPEINMPPTATNQTVPALPTSKWLVRGLIGLAASVAFLCFVFWPESTPSVFARLQNALAAVDSVSYVVVDEHSDGKRYETRIFIREPNLSKSIQQQVAGPGSPNHLGTFITDWNQKLSISIHDGNKKAVIRELEPTAETTAKRSLFLNKLRNVSENSIEHLGESTWNGEPAEAFLMPIGDRQFRVIVSSVTGLPVEMEYHGARDGNPGFKESFVDFVFDADLDPTLFSVVPPEGYTVTRHHLAAPNANGALLTISTTSGLNDLPFGTGRQAVIDLLGEPARTHTSYSNESLHYPNYGMIITITESRGLSGINCQSQARHGSWVHDFAGETAEGIGIGDSLDAVVAAYGQPDLMHMQVAQYIRKGWQFIFQEGKVTGINVERPLTDDFDFSVSPDDGSYSIFMKENE